MSILIIAEAGINHNGNLGLAQEMIEQAKWSGADVIKFQTFSGLDSKLSKYELSRDDHIGLMKKCGQMGIEFLSTAFDIESVELLHDLGLTRWKIPSGQITDLPYLRKIASFKERVILSTGMATMGEIENALNVLGKADVTLLHCTSEYPAAWENVNLLAIERMRDYFNLDIGYSDHTIGRIVPQAATALGATIIEKHFMVNPVCPDNVVSLPPQEFALMCSTIRLIEIAMGSPVKLPTLRELDNKKLFRKSIVASRKILIGEVLCEENITTKRPGTGTSPMEWNNIVGMVAMKSYESGEQI
jgi:N,N'-diacetyllegionaminate synthase